MAKSQNEEFKSFDWPLNGRLITGLDPSLLPEGHFQKLQNLRYNDGGIEAIAGMTPINATALSSTILVDGSFEDWSISTSLRNWTLSGTSASVNREGTIIKSGLYSAKLTRASGDAYLTQDIQNAGNQTITYWQGKVITFGAWVYASVASRAYLYVADGVGTTTSSAHSGTPGWEYIVVTHTVAAAATKVEVSCLVKTANTSAYFDISEVVEGTALWDGVNGLAYLQSFYSTVHSQGTYSLKGMATVSSLGKSFIRTGVIANLTGVNTIQFDIYSSRTGANLEVGIRNLNGTITRITPTVTSASSWETKTWDISTVANADKNFIDQITVTVVDAAAANTFLLDNFKVT